MDNSQLSIDVLMSFLEPGRGVEPLPGSSSFILLYGLDSLSCVIINFLRYNVHLRH